MKSKKGTWLQAFKDFLTPIALLLVIRWLLFEPFVIPSGSMIPTLLIHDHIFVNKLAYGLRLPFSEKYFVWWDRPVFGDIVVFKFPENKDVFYIKRVIGTPGDVVEIKSGRVFLNEKEVPVEAQNKNNLISKLTSGPVGEDDLFNYYLEGAEKKHSIRLYPNGGSLRSYGPTKIPDGNYFVMGDNRDQSSDSRVWGFVPEGNLMGRAGLIWLGCKETLASAQYLCDPSTISWNRIIKKPE